jgi:uncharacterized protein (TIRG00374 family)
MVRRILIGAAIGAGLSWLLFRNTDWAAVVLALRTSQPTFLLFSIVMAVAGHLTRVQRWTYAVRAVRPARFRTVFASAQLGFLLNVLLPLRLGEAARALVLAQSVPVRSAKAFALVAVDRFADLLGLLPILIVTLVFFAAPGIVPVASSSFEHAGEISLTSRSVWVFAASALSIVVALGTVLVVTYRHHDAVGSLVDFVLARRWPSLSARIRNVVVGFSDGMHVFRSTADMTYAMMFSFAGWACGIVSLAAIMTAFGIEYFWYTPFVMQALIAVFMTLPLAPGLVGQYHAAVVVSLLLAAQATPSPIVKAMALTTHLIAVGVVLVLGLVAMALEQRALPRLLAGAGALGTGRAAVEPTETGETDE